MKSFKDRYDITGRVALITGGAGLLGVKHAEAIAEIGGLAVLLDVDEKKAETEAAAIKDYYKINTSWYKCDISTYSDVYKVLKQVLAELGRIDILINNAAIDSKVEDKDTENNTSRFENFDLNNWQNEFNVGVTGLFICSCIFGSYMVKQKYGVIINIGSDLSFIAPNQNIYASNKLRESDQPVKPFSYSVIKHSILGLSKYFSAKFAPSGVRVNLLAPGGVWNNKLTDEFVNELTDHIPLGRMAQQDDYKGSIQFLSSDASLYMTGTNLLVDGGRTTGSV
jgi:NAD(P)-dependent dehydrogenase (short-subunit alcohol dehydrogenase family)